MILSEIENTIPRLRNSEKKVAMYMLEQKWGIEKMSLEDVARGAEVSQPTVMRMVKAVGYESFKEIKRAFLEERLKQENHAQTMSRLFDMKIERNDQIEDIPTKVIRNVIHLMEDSLKIISAKELKRTIESIKSAERIVIFSVENSNSIANDLVTKLLYLGIPCIFYEDYYLQSVSAGHLKKGDVAIGISYTGSSKNTVNMLRIAKKAGAKTIAITNFSNTPLVKYADIVITTSSQQHLFGDTIFSRTIHLAVVDMIYMGLIVSDYDKYMKEMEMSRKLILERAYDE